MKIEPVGESAYVLRGLVNVYLIKVEEGWALIDSGFANSADKILAAIQSVGVSPGEVRHLILTHAHPDHIGSAAALKRATGADVYAHAVDAPIMEKGTGFRRGTPAPGLRNAILFKLLLAPSLRKPLEPTHVEHFVGDGDTFPFAPDLMAIHVPGHSAGQVALLWRREGGVLFTADACINISGLDLAAAHEDIAETRRSLAKLCRLDFQKACFGHGPAITSNAGEQFRLKWGTSSGATPARQAS